ncbi:MAG: YegP family protein [Sphingomonadaceae bacterium]
MYYQKWKDTANQWRWHLRAANHEIISSGEGYWNESDCDHAISLNKGSSTAPVYKR